LGEATYRSRDLVERIWHEVAVEAELAAEPVAGPPPEFSFLIHDEERHYINSHWELDTSPADLPRVGRLGGVKARFKKRAAVFVVTVLERYLTEEKHLIAHMVRFQNNVAINHDRLAEELRQLHQQVPSEARRLWQRDAMLYEILNERIAELEREIDKLKGAPGRP
jgi:hypothetical protein